MICFELTCVFESEVGGVERVVAEKRAEQLPETASVVLQGAGLLGLIDFFFMKWSPKMVSKSSSYKVCVLRPFRYNSIRLMHPDNSLTWD